MRHCIRDTQADGISTLCGKAFGSDAPAIFHTLDTWFCSAEDKCDPICPACARQIKRKLDRSR